MSNKEYIEIKINNKIKKVYLNKKIQVNKDLDYICIEIPKYDDIEILEFDYKYNNNENKKEVNQDIIIITINKDKEMKIIKNILEDFYNKEIRPLERIILLNKNQKLQEYMTKKN